MSLVATKYYTPECGRNPDTFGCILSLLQWYAKIYSPNTVFQPSSSDVNISLSYRSHIFCKLLQTSRPKQTYPRSQISASMHHLRCTTSPAHGQSTDFRTEMPSKYNAFTRPDDSVDICRSGKWKTLEKCNKQSYCKSFLPSRL
jgi:hypothetical protein